MNRRRQMRLVHGAHHGGGGDREPLIITLRVNDVKGGKIPACELERKPKRIEFVSRRQDDDVVSGKVRRGTLAEDGDLVPPFGKGIGKSVRKMSHAALRTARQKPLKNRNPEFHRLSSRYTSSVCLAVSVQVKECARLKPASINRDLREALSKMS